jgi:hypothetical protein
VRVDGFAILVNFCGCCTCLTCGVEILLTTPFFLRKLSSNGYIRRCHMGKPTVDEISLKGDWED